MEYIFILAAVLLISPFVLRFASKQDKKTKLKTKTIFLSILIMQLVLGFFDWESFTGFGRNGFELSFSYPNSLLGLFFIVVAVQIILLLISKSFSTLVVVLNFAGSIIIFAGMIRLSNILGFQAVSFASVLAVFAVLLGNVAGLVWINKDRNLFRKYIT
ncbi:hypothetical protein HYW46_00075 [Candidatus Daviesbacteria bacterium]|nr:hypothetical protein [Candidatus Daviesbacteria bacterium]